ncbi:MAG: glycosyltransferase family 4 protein [Pseudobdellovibrionaceae bacterium]
MSFLISFAITLCFVPLLKRLALRIRFTDKPDERKTHEGNIPPIGGIAIFLPFLALMIAENDETVFTSTPFYCALSLLLITGVIDDARHINAKLKFVIHFIAAILVVWGGANLVTMGNLFGYGITDFGMLAPFFSVCCVVYLINAMNMIDGVDGLAGGVSLVIVAFLGLACVTHGVVMPTGLAMLGGGLCGFLVYNLRSPFRKKASVFLGDAGSMSLGLILAWYAMSLSQEPYALFAPITVAWILAFPIWDAFGLFSARIREGRHPFSPDRRHFHHHFLEAGFTPGQTTVIITCYAALLGAIGVFLPATGVPVWVLTYIWIILWIAHAQLTFKPNSFIRFLRRIRGSSSQEEQLQDHTAH